MTVKEFNEKYKDYLECRFYGLAIDNEQVINYLDKKFEQIIESDVNKSFKYYQIKLKFNEVCCYFDKDHYENSNEIQDAIKQILNDNYFGFLIYFLYI